MARHARDPWRSIGGAFAKRNLSARGGGPRWGQARHWALAPLVLLVGLYSAFGVVFLVIPARLATALIRGPRRLLGRLSRWIG